MTSHPPKLILNNTDTQAMTDKQELHAKALELAILIQGPLSASDLKDLQEDNHEAPHILGKYMALSQAIVGYFDNIPQD
jgi:hypothetical protein